ncbi:hypothetical protein Q094_01822 [Pseudomonas aeruginosa PS42]|nr:hypothetical protein Q094_01822 [Pseudomonas aeruginosa PS42]
MVGTIVAIQSFGRQWVQGGRLPYSFNSCAGSSRMNYIHQVPPDTASLVRWVNKNTSDDITVETGSANNVFAQ